MQNQCTQSVVHDKQYLCLLRQPYVFESRYRLINAKEVWDVF